MARSDKALHLDCANGKFLGVCAGLANYLGVEPWGVRLVFLGCVIFGGWFLVPLYFILWFLLDDSSASVRDSLADNLMVKHFRTVDYRKKLWRNTRDGKILGVCAGLADYLEVNVFAVRVVFLVLTFFTGFPLLFYFGSALVLDKRPWDDYDIPASRMAPEPAPAAAGSTAGPRMTREPPPRRGPDVKQNQYSKRREFQYCARKFATLQGRMARLEAYVTSSRFKLHREFKNIS
jgi:phage shock protein C